MEMGVLLWFIWQIIYQNNWQRNNYAWKPWSLVLVDILPHPSITKCGVQGIKRYSIYINTLYSCEPFIFISLFRPYRIVSVLTDIPRTARTTVHPSNQTPRQKNIKKNIEKTQPNCTMRTRKNMPSHVAHTLITHAHIPRTKWNKTITPKGPVDSKSDSGTFQDVYVEPDLF